MLFPETAISFMGVRSSVPSGLRPRVSAALNWAYVQPFSPVASGVRLRAAGQLGSPPAIGPPLRSAPWHPEQIAARCLPNSALAASAGGYTRCGVSWVAIRLAQDCIFPVAARTLPSGPKLDLGTVWSTGGRERM